MILKTGKLDSEMLKQIVFDKIKYSSGDVKVRPGIGEDCTVVDFGDFDCVMSTDPITSAVSDIGRLAIHITCNDIASNGVKPLGIMLAAMLPEGTTDDDIAHMMAQAGETAAALEVDIIGGHTEITPAVNQPVIVSTAIGKCLSGNYEPRESMRSGDLIMMTKSAGLEGSGIIAGDYADMLIKGGMTEAAIEKAKSFLDRVSVVPEGIAAGQVGTHGMHDITEGGVLGAVWEMCQISDLGCEVWEDAIPLEAETKSICEICGINPLRLISSGSMIMIVAPENKEAMFDAMAKASVDISVIGQIMPKEYGNKLLKTASDEAGGTVIDPPGADELYKVVGK